MQAPCASGPACLASSWHLVQSADSGLCAQAGSGTAEVQNFLWEAPWLNQAVAGGLCPCQIASRHMLLDSSQGGSG